MDAVFDALGDATRRRILEVLAAGEQTAGTVVESVQAELSISQPAISQHLRVLREAGLVAARADGTRRFYAVDSDGLDAAQSWLAQVAEPTMAFSNALDALATEVERGKRRPRTGERSSTGRSA